MIIMEICVIKVKSRIKCLMKFWMRLLTVRRKIKINRLLLLEFQKNGFHHLIFVDQFLVGGKLVI